MPSSIGTSLLVLAAVTTALSPLAAVVIAVLAVGYEIFLALIRTP